MRVGDYMKKVSPKITGYWILMACWYIIPFIIRTAVGKPRLFEGWAAVYWILLMIIIAAEYFKYDYYFAKNFPDEYKSQMRRNYSSHNIFKNFLQFETDPDKTDDLTQYKRRLNNLIKFAFISFLVTGVMIFLGF